MGRIAGLLASLLLLLSLTVRSAHADTITVDILDVGQGDSILIRNETGKTVLIDAGKPASGVVEKLRARGVDHIDLLVMTHPHADHIAEMDDVINAFPVAFFMSNGFPATTEVYTSMMNLLQQKQVKQVLARVGGLVNMGPTASMEILWPQEQPLRGSRSDANSNSVVLRLTHGLDCMLFMGDSEEVTEQRLLARNLQTCQVLKVAHHGGSYSSQMPFLGAVHPAIAIISVGEDNTYGHPSPETMTRLRSKGAVIYRTDFSGSLEILLRGNGDPEVLEGMDPTPMLGTGTAERPRTSQGGY